MGSNRGGRAKGKWVWFELITEQLITILAGTYLRRNKSAGIDREVCLVFSYPTVCEDERGMKGK